MDSSISNHNNTAGKLDYLLECYRAAHEELMLRIKSRDNWLRIQLLSQGVILALAYGIEFQGGSTSAPTPIVLLVAPILSFIIACFYYVEDKLVSVLSRYSAAVSTAEAELRSGKVVLNSAASTQLHSYFSTASLLTGGLYLRVVGQVVIFILLPGLLFLLRINSTPFQSLAPQVQVLESMLNTTFFVFIGIVTKRNFDYRKKGGTPPTKEEVILVDSSPGRQGEPLNANKIANNNDA
ncbi:MAG: hypothetical protein WCD37_04215 [Chloroflexia bacterium]